MGPYLPGHLRLLIIDYSIGSQYSSVILARGNTIQLLIQLFCSWVVTELLNEYHLGLPSLAFVLSD